MKEVPISLSRTVRKETLTGATAFYVSSPSGEELFLTSAPVAGEGPAAVLARAAQFVRANGFEVISQDVLGLRNRDGSATQMLAEAFGDVSWPVTWIEPGDNERQDMFGTQIWAVSGTRVKRLERNGRVTGSVIENDAVEYLRLGGVVPESGTDAQGQQARNVLEQMESQFRSLGLSFRDVARTWFYADRILAWYGDFNKVRTTFFEERNVFNGLMPASTGIGAANESGRALVAGAIAMRPKLPETKCIAIDSPLQGPAAAYGSSFSRAVEIVEPGLRRLLISGTASIDPDGKTVHLDDIDAQIKLTMDVVYAILESRGMGWDDVSRAIAYFKTSRDYPAYEAYAAKNGLESLPVVSICADVCRDDLLFEIEVDALKA